MFSFMRKKNDIEDGDSYPKPALNEGEQPHSTLGDAEKDQTDTGPAESADASSSFSFMHGEVPSEDAPVSSFSFLQQGNSDPSTLPDSESLPNTGFGFMSTPSSSEPSESGHAPANTSFSFLNQTSNPSDPEPFQEIKLAKVASTKTVKKKKRVSRVGAGREEEGDDDGSVTNGSAENSPKAPSSFAPAVVCSINRSSALDAVAEEADPCNDSANAIDTIPRDDPQTSIQESTNGRDIPPPPVESPALPPRPKYSPVSPSVAQLSLPSNEEEPRQHDVNLAGIDSVPGYASSVQAPEPPSSAAPPTPPVTVENDGMDTLEATMCAFAVSQLDSMMKTKQLSGEIEADAACSAHLVSKIYNLETEQAKLAAVEEFEKADTMNGELDDLRDKLRECETRIAERSEQIKRTALALEVTRSEFIVQMRETVRNLQNETSSEESAVTGNLQALNEQRTVMNAEWKTELARIEAEKAIVDKDEMMINEEIQIVEDGINSQTSEYLIEKQSLEAESFSVEHEIEELIKQLELKRQESSRLKNDLKKIDVKIGEVRKKYERQLRRGHDRRAEHVQLRHEIKEDEARVLQEKLKKEQDISSQMGILIRAQQRVTTVAINSEISSLVVCHLTKEMERESDATLLSILSPSISSVQTSSNSTDEVITTKSLWARAQQEHAQLEADLQQLESEMRALDEKVPKLESEKKVHAASKRFKEAAASASAIKAVFARKEEIEQKITSLSAELATTADAVKKCADDYQVALQAQGEKNLDKERMRLQELAARATELRKLGAAVMHLQADAKKRATDALLSSLGKDAATFAAESDFLENKFSSSALDFVQYELTAIVNEGQRISKRLSSSDDTDSLAVVYGLGNDSIAIETIENVPSAVEEISSTPEDDCVATDETIAVEDGDVNPAAIAISESKDRLLDANNDSDYCNVDRSIDHKMPEESRGSFVNTEDPEVDAAAARAAAIQDALGLFHQVEELENEMAAAADADDFELAAEIQDKLSILEPQFLEIKRSLSLSNEDLLRLQ